MGCVGVRQSVDGCDGCDGWQSVDGLRGCAAIGPGLCRRSALPKATVIPGHIPPTACREAEQPHHTSSKDRSHWSRGAANARRRAPHLPTLPTCQLRRSRGAANARSRAPHLPTLPTCQLRRSRGAANARRGAPHLPTPPCPPASSGTSSVPALPPHLPATRLVVWSPRSHTMTCGAEGGV